ncbi:MAG: type II toxin-antitoxin system HicB family antitoxin [Candidatus Woesearchaeota archaeon]
MQKNIKNTDIMQEMARYNVIIEKDSEGWFISEVVELPGCHTQAKTIPLLLERTKEAIKAYLGADENIEISEKFVGVRQVEV